MHKERNRGVINKTMNVKDMVLAISNSEPQPFPGSRRALACFHFCEGVPSTILETGKFLDFNTHTKTYLDRTDAHVDSFDDFEGSL